MIPSLYLGHDDEPSSDSIDVKSVVVVLGALLESTVGASLGERLDWSVGNELGIVLGVVDVVRLGASDGARVGDTVGASDGARVGDTIGAIVGSEEGDPFGRKAGIELRIRVVGPIDGSSVASPRDGSGGANDGARVEDTAGAIVGSEEGDPFGREDGIELRIRVVGPIDGGSIAGPRDGGGTLGGAGRLVAVEGLGVVGDGEGPLVGLSVGVAVGGAIGVAVGDLVVETVGVWGTGDAVGGATRATLCCSTKAIKVPVAQKSTAMILTLVP
jgi:hypothetical protein